ncbi:uncharacterized protein LOC118644391 [Monomorium pharaonis]|uniref:uncharacterized protein LOC118644391 n=1 Tax=Monomorium pharaonis TaxID=307658 RepID=UPI001746974F|nr:uncharacterized protein LOC118644391 [Monomorium pharaonis]
METCQSVSKIISDVAKRFHPSRLVKPDDVLAINNSDKRSVNPQPINCQENVLLQTTESSVVTDQNGYVAGQGRGSKRKLEDLEDRAMITAKLDLAADNRQDRSRTTERIKPRVKDTLTTSDAFSSDEKAVRNRIRNGRVPTDGKSFWKRHVSTPKYASFLRMFRKEGTDDRLYRNSSSRRNKGKKSQHRRGLSAERYNPER